MQCPNCRNLMVQTQYESTVIDACETCGGVWLDEGEIALIVKDKTKTFSLEDRLASAAKKGQDRKSPSTLPCPKCQKPMALHQYAYNSGVFIDRCPDKHGVWLDRNEIDRIQILMEKEENPRSNAKTPMLKASRHCPVDGTRLQVLDYEEAELDICPKCKGLWCDSDELQQIVASDTNVIGTEHLQGLHTSQQNPAAVSHTESLSDLACVVCDQKLARLTYSYSSGIVIDCCPHRHGVWLDHTEIEKVQAFAEHWKKVAPQMQGVFAKILKKADEQMHTYDEAVVRGVESALSKTWLMAGVRSAAKLFKK